MQMIKKNKLTTKDIIIILSISMIFMFCIIMTKSYAIYKLQRDFNLMKSQIGTYKTGDYSVAVLVDGKETDTFPSYEDNYKVESVDCTNGVTATFDVKNWQLNIADMSATSCKCTVSFNSKEKNDITPIAMSKTELLALNENITNTTYEIMKTKLLNDTYPVGSVYMSTEDDTVDKVQTKFGGTWVKYASGTTLLSVDDDHEINSTGGASSVKLSTGNIPSLSVTGTTNNTGSGYTIGYGSSSRAVSSWSGAHSHQENDQIWTNTAPTVGGSHYVARGTSGNYMTVRTNGGGMRAAIYTANTTLTVSGQTVSDYYANKITGVESHNHSFTGNYTNSSQTDVDIQNPYTAVYMYKRTA